jgi:hypothetical protein
MAKITLPKTACMRGGALDIWYHDLADFDESISRTLSGANVIIENNFDLSITEINNIITAGGTIEEMLTAVRISNWTTFRALLVPVGVEKSIDIFSTTNAQLSFANWLRRGEVWHKSIDSVMQAVFYTNMNGATKDLYLKGVDIQALEVLDLTEHMKLADANALIIADSWIKYE